MTGQAHGLPLRDQVMAEAARRREECQHGIPGANGQLICCRPINAGPTPCCDPGITGD